MESSSPHSFNSKKNISNYVLMPLAVVQSEIYWLCSVLYYIFKQSWDNLDEQQHLEDKKRRRANSAPARSLSTPTPGIDNHKEEHHHQHHQQQQHSVKFADKHKIESYNANLPTKSLRRTSLPNINIRHRPSVHDERKGTTCPPLWWQKTRVKLGHAPVHGDPKPIMTSLMLDNSERAASVLIANNNNSIAITSLSQSTPSSTTSSPSASTRPSLEQDRTESSSSSIQSQESNNTNKQRDDTSTTSKKGSKFISKISAAFHKRSRSRD